MTACESAGYTVASLSITLSLVFWGGSSALATLFSFFMQIFLLFRPKCISSPRRSLLVCFSSFFLLPFWRIRPEPRAGPFFVPSFSRSLSRTPICISPHIGKLLRARVSLNATRKRSPGDFGGNPPVITPSGFDAGSARCQVSRLFRSAPYGRFWLHVHDT